MHRRKMVGWAASLPLAGLSGCITTAMHQDSTYSEKLQGVLISADKKSLVVVGVQYHYVFAAPAQVAAALDPQLQPGIEAASFQGFRVGPDNRIQGQLILQTRRDASASQLQAALQAGFQDRGGQLAIEVLMTGQRYAVRNEMPLPLQKLNRDYYVYITEDTSDAKKFLKAAATPVTVAADGVLFIGAVLLSPLWLPLLIAKL
ncbi:hypothetical protein ACS5PN_10255 [Roseateles sp. NT4]|uniref:hypothetical protein n=1 Tax=Roseateles sp. NT4 TaxID=3453715 RepID=UPI003EE8AC98